MKYRTVVINVPILSLPSPAKVWSVAWRFLILFCLTAAGFVVAESWPDHKFTIGLITGIWFAMTEQKWRWI